MSAQGAPVPPPVPVSPAVRPTGAGRSGLLDNPLSGPGADDESTGPVAPRTVGGARGTQRGGGRGRGRGRREDQGPPAGPDDVEADPEGMARTIVLRKLAAQARTRHELAEALSAREVPEDVAEAVLDRMEAVGLVDDEAFARDWVESRQQRRHLSRSALRRELQTKGIDRDQIDEAVAGVETDDEVQAALALATKKVRSLQGLEREVQYRRLAGALARRGFSGAVAATVLSQVLDRPRD
ncbi:hypothetical protein GCM10009616_09400 [Microlunatus lacustris]